MVCLKLLSRSITEHLTPTCRRISDLKLHLQDTRDVQRALISLSSALKSCIPSLEKQLSDASIREYFSRFPDAIFAIIFEFAGFEDVRTTINFSHVCRRFRAISLSVPRLWTIISPTTNCQLSDAIGIAERSQSAGCGLTIKIAERWHDTEEPVE